MIENPILPGFNPDPSMCRVGDDYYIATSTFEWYPGVQIHHSKDLVNWTLAVRPLDRASQLDMRGNPDSGGVWAPCLSYSDGLFWLVYTDMKRHDGDFKDAHNYIVTAPSIDGPWSDPVYANSSGFDPSLFHDDDGRKWFLNMVWSHRGDTDSSHPTHSAFDGILLQEFNAIDGKLTGPIKNIYKGTKLGISEAPHLYKRNGWYYLTVAEGGTGYEHAIAMARCRSIDGEYELHPGPYLITAKDHPDNKLQRTGHGQIVETPDGQTYHTFLCSRPIPGLADNRSPLGRESGIEKCVWGDDDWLYLEHGGTLARVSVPAPDPATRKITKEYPRRNFGESLPPEFQWLRTPYPERLFKLTGSALRLFARESLGSWFEQSLVARRQEHMAFTARTGVSFAPVNYQQSAGLIYYYNRHKFHYIGITQHETHGRILAVISCNGDWPDSRLSIPTIETISVGDSVELGMQVDHASMNFSYRVGNDWQTIAHPLDASIISDEAGRGEHASFTGAFVGMAAFDITGGARPADFSYFHYAPQ